MTGGGQDPAALARGEYADRYLERTPAAAFDWRVYLGLFDARLLATSRGRRALTRYRPVLFALLYLRRHLTNHVTGEVSLAAWHLDWLRRGLRWCLPPAGDTGTRDADIAPRESGKTTIFYLVLPCWAGAHEHRRFVIAFSDSATQAEDHLATFKAELDTNALLREDYHGLVRPARRGVGATMADRKSLYISRSGFAFAARGMDTAILGAKIGDQRPDLMLLDDIEPKASNYSLARKGKRLSTLVDAIMPLAVSAAIQVVGTVTMVGSIVHNLVLKGMERTGARELDDGEREACAWVDEQGFAVHHYRPLVPDPDTGERVSAWPAKWTTAYLTSIEHTRSYQLNYDNDPVDVQGSYWATSDVTILEEGTQVHTGPMLLSIDPAVTTKDTSDWTGLAVVGYERAARRCVTFDVRQVKVEPGAALRRLVLDILGTWPEIGGVLIESNQGGDAWRAILHDLPVPMRTQWNGEPKDVRALRLHGHHQRGRVVHARRFASYLAQLVTYPLGHDDMIDAEGNAVDRLLPRADPTASGRRRSRAYPR